MYYRANLALCTESDKEIPDKRKVIVNLMKFVGLKNYINLIGMLQGVPGV